MDQNNCTPHAASTIEAGRNLAPLAQFQDPVKQVGDENRQIARLPSIKDLLARIALPPLPAHPQFFWVSPTHLFTPTPLPAPPSPTAVYFHPIAPGTQGVPVSFPLPPPVLNAGIPQPVGHKRSGEESPTPTPNTSRNSPTDLNNHAASKKVKPNRRRPASLDKDTLFCHICATRTTPEWRRGPGGPATLCNACGLAYAKRSRIEDEGGTSSALLSGSSPLPVGAGGQEASPQRRSRGGSDPGPQNSSPNQLNAQGSKTGTPSSPSTSPNHFIFHTYIPPAISGRSAIPLTPQ